MSGFEGGILTEGGVLTTCALRFDGYQYTQDTSFDAGKPVEDFFTTGAWNLARDEQLAVFYLLQRDLCKWALVYEPLHGKYYRAFRDLFLHVYDMEIPRAYQLQPYHTQWEQEYRPHLEQCADLVRYVHEHTPYDDDAPSYAESPSVHIPPSLTFLQYPAKETSMTYHKKLIEVALPLEAINKESAREKSIRHGHPSTLHLWWARRPLAACRAVLFASLVDDPSAHPEQFPTKEDQERERQRLFRIIEELVKWENSNNERVLNAARAEIMRSTNGNPPPVLDPFAGGGSIPLEAQRLGLEAHASDLNPVAVLINKALIEIPPKFANMPPINPEARKKIGHGATWTGAQGLAEDLRYYGGWMRDEAFKRIGHLYPKVGLPPENGNGDATVIAWIWARTVKCPNPACGTIMPLVRSFSLSTKKEKATWAEPLPVMQAKRVQFVIRPGAGMPTEGTVDRKGARCVVCKAIAPLEYVRSEGMNGRLGHQLMAIAAEGRRGRIYLPSTADTTPELTISAVEYVQAVREEYLSGETPKQLTGGTCYGYGLTKWGLLFTPRQILALRTFSELIAELRQQVQRDSAAYYDGSSVMYANAVATYLALAIDRSVDRGSTICSWDSSPKMEALRNTFARQALPMTWDYAEGNPFSESSGNWMGNVEWIADVVGRLTEATKLGSAQQHDAATAIFTQNNVVVSTDPPYYDNISYADLSDFFYVWLRQSLAPVYPDLFGTLQVPKVQELVATPYRFGGDRSKAQLFFEEGLGKAFQVMAASQNALYPLTIYYAFKQAEAEGSAEIDTIGETVVASTGWETMLEGLVRAGFSIHGTWPMRSELANRMIARGTNALASSIVLVCRPRPKNAPMATRREFQAALRRELPEALRMLQHGNVAPVDLAQAAIGPGMAVFSRYAKVVEADGAPMRVRTALQLINQALDEVLQEQEGEYDVDTRWAVAWFDQYGMTEGPFGVAETLSKAKNTSVGGMVEAGIVQAHGGKVRLLRRDQLPEDWNPTGDKRRTIWEVTQHLIRALELHGEGGAASLMAQVGSDAETARDLAYRLYTTCERKGWAQEALAYNSLVVAWSGIQLQSTHIERQPTQTGWLS